MNDGMMPVLEMLKRLGYDGVEIPIFNTSLDYAQWGKRLDNLGLQRTAVTVRGADDNPISADSAVRQRGVEATRRVLGGLLVALSIRRGRIEQQFGSWNQYLI